MCPWSISQAEAQLDPGLFVRVHRSHIVAMAHVSFVRREGDGAVIELDGPSPHRVPVSRAKIAEVKARLGLRRGAQAHCGPVPRTQRSAKLLRSGALQSRGRNGRRCLVRSRFCEAA
jgi:hypothetical protein